MKKLKFGVVFVALGGILFWVANLALDKLTDMCYTYYGIGTIRSRPVLKETENAKVIVDLARKRVTTITRKLGNGGGSSLLGSPDVSTNSFVIKDFQGVRKAVIVLGRDGELTVKAKTKGFVLEPGLAAGALLGADNPTRVCADFRVFFWQKTALHLGAHIGVSTIKPGLYVAAGYTPTYRLPNTEVIAGVTEKKQILVGLRLGF